MSKIGFFGNALFGMLMGMVLTPLSAPAAIATFTPLGELPGRSFLSIATRVSADGTTVVGGSDSTDGQVGFRWTGAAGMQRVPMPPGSGNSAQNTSGVSSNGSIVVGGAWGNIAYQWTSATGSVGLPNPQNNATAMDITSDGAAIAGTMFFASNLTTDIVAWDGAGFHESGIFIDGNARVSISNTGQTIASTRTISGGNEGFLWSVANGTRGLGDLAGGALNSGLRDISPNGMVGVGWATGPTGPAQAALWTDAGGWDVISNPFGITYGGSAEGASADGSVIVGWFGSPSGERPFFWDRLHGARLLDDLLTANGAILSGYTLRNPNDFYGNPVREYDVSADGLTIVGSGINPSGFTEAWIATLPASAVPEPSCATLATSVAIVWSGVKRRKRAVKEQTHRPMNAA
jgi:uncharacterized membrane protein